MDEKIANLRMEIATLQNELHELVSKGETAHASRPEDAGAFFDENTLHQHKTARIPVIPYVLNLPLRVHFSGPFVYGMIIPIAFLDISLVVFQAICFRLWHVPRVRRRDYVIVDRHHLAYLNGVEKLNCIYCGYANGVLAFAQELAARTEKHWCPIKHAARTRQPHSYYDEFIEFGDVDAWRNHPSRKTPNKSCKDCWNKRI